MEALAIKGGLIINNGRYIQKMSRKTVERAINECVTNRGLSVFLATRNHESIICKILSNMSLQNVLFNGMSPIASISESKHMLTILFKNGSVFRAGIIPEGSRGFRYNRLIIDDESNIDEKLIECIYVTAIRKYSEDVSKMRIIDATRSNML